VQDGLPLLLPYVTRQVLQPTVQEFLNLIEGRSLYVPEEARAVPADAAAAGDSAAAAGDSAAAAGDSAAAAGDSAPAAMDGASVANDAATDQEVKLEAEDQSNEANVAGQLAAEVYTVILCFCVSLLTCYSILSWGVRPAISACSPKKLLDQVLLAYAVQ